MNAAPSRGCQPSLLPPAVVSLMSHVGEGMYLWKTNSKGVRGMREGVREIREGVREIREGVREIRDGVREIREGV